MDISVRRLTDYSIAIETNKECWNEMCEDNTEIAMPDLINEYYLSVFKDNEYCGFFRICEVTSVLFESHAVLLKKNRRYSMEFTRKMYEWLLANLPIRKLVCNIPSFNKKTIKFARKMGFTFQGENPESFMRGGKLCSMMQFGINIRKMGEICHQQPYL